MPDGGYPLHLFTPVTDSPFVLHAHGADLHLKERFFPDPESRKFQLVSHGAFSSSQVTALLFHLLEWGSTLSESEIRRLTYRRSPLAPQFEASTCWYGY